MEQASILSAPPPALNPAPALEKRLALPELLAPAGDWECARAAVENGADAIYFGLDKFNARMRARNFTEADLPELMKFLHRRGVRGYVTFNTLLFADELESAAQYLRTIMAAGVDAAIVQDAGACQLIRQLSPDFPIHASTQMTISSAAGVQFARDLGCELVVLARECSIQEITKIQQAFPPGGSLPLEVFVHGALCVAYSGQCLTSEALGGRSANRGECAQACRLPYDLISDGQKVPLDGKRYLLSPQDLAGLEILPQLIHAGVASLKIEGRLKSPEYVASITRIYRRALDESATRIRNNSARDKNHPHPSIPDDSRYAMEMAFSRGLHTGWFGGINNQALVHARFGKKRGVYLGEVLHLDGQSIAVRLTAPLKPGDGVVFDSGNPDQDEQGGRIYQIQSRGKDTLLSFGRGDLDLNRIRPGHKIWKTSDPELDAKIRATYQGDQPRFRRPLHIAVHGASGEPLTVIARDELGHIAQASSQQPLAEAVRQPLTQARLQEQLGRLGNTPFVLQNLECHLQGDVILPIHELNALRRQVVAQLEDQRTRPKRWTLTTTPVQLTLPRDPAPDQTPPNLIVLIRNLQQLDAALASGVSTVYCEFEDLKKYRDAVKHFHSWHQEHSAGLRPAQAAPPPQQAPPSIWVAPPRIFKMGEDWILHQVLSSEPDGFLVRNYDHLAAFQNRRVIGDFSLNISNPLSAEIFKTRFGLERLTASYDLNIAQLQALLASAPPRWFEITLHQHMPMFHMEHCVFCAFLSSGTDFTNCGRPCDHHQVQLRDRVGAEHPLKADAGCRNTVFNARAQTGAEYAQHLIHLGVRHFRIEFLNEDPSEVSQTIRRYQQLLSGAISGTDLWRELKLTNQLGVTRGQLQSRS